MALVVRNCFDLLADDEEIEYSNKKKPAATTPSLPNAGKKKNQKQKQKQAPAMKKQETNSEASSTVRHDNFVRRSGTTIFRTPNPKEKQHVTNFDDAIQTQTVVSNVERKLSLKEYEKELLEKKKTLNLNNAADHEERKLSRDKDFESMTLVGKKKEDYGGLLVKPAKPDIKANKVHNNKVANVNGFFQVPVTRSRRPPPRSYPVDNGESTSATNKADASATTTAINIEDDAQFPALN